MRWLIILLVLLISAPAFAQDAGAGTLTLVVRDPTGQPLAGVTIRLIHDTDLDGRITVGTYPTDTTGTIAVPALPWGMYIVQFQGQSPDGRPMLPPAQQNVGLLEDGSGLDGGFGVRFAEPARTELFVLGSISGEAAAVPMFDLAPSADAPPQPFDPLLAPPGPTPTPVTLRDALASRPAAAPPGRFDRAALWCFGLLLLLGGSLVALGWWRTRQPPPPKGDTP